jgi:hypothetical protein
MYVYVSEDSWGIDNFSNGLLWKQGGLVYGDWYGGPTQDGVYTHSLTVPLSQVCVPAFESSFVSSL